MSVLTDRHRKQRTDMFTDTRSTKRRQEDTVSTHQPNKQGVVTVEVGG